MERVASFEKVSFNQFRIDYSKTIGESDDSVIKRVYESIMLPVRATKGSAGYDFCSTVDFVLNPGETINIPTGVRVKIEDGWVLSCYPRSGLGFKYRLQLNNTVGIIDSDYYDNEGNEGHFYFQYYNFNKEELHVKKGDVIGQVIFMKFLTCDDDCANGIRTGGFGSTDK